MQKWVANQVSVLSTLIAIHQLPFRYIILQIPCQLWVGVVYDMNKKVLSTILFVMQMGAVDSLIV